MKKVSLVIMLALLCVVMLAGSPGCGSQGASTDDGETSSESAKTETENGDTETGDTGGGGTGMRPDPEDTVTAFWAALSSGDVTGALAFCSDTMQTRALKKLFMTFLSAEGGEYDAEVQQFLAGLGLEPFSSEVKGDRAMVRMEMTAPDLSRIDLVFDQMMALSIDMAEAEDYSGLSPELIIQRFTLEFVKLLNTLPAATTEKNVSLMWEDGAWKITSDPFEELEEYFAVFQGDA